MSPASPTIDILSAGALIREMRRLLSSPSSWTRQAYARDSAGKEVAYNSPLACRYCFTGAYLRSLGNLQIFPSERDHFHEAYSRFSFSLNCPGGVSAYQDRHDFATLQRLIASFASQLEAYSSPSPANP